MGCTGVITVMKLRLFERAVAYPAGTKTVFLLHLPANLRGEYPCVSSSDTLSPGQDRAASAVWNMTSGLLFLSTPSPKQNRNFQEPG